MRKTKPTEYDLKRALIVALEDQFYPAQKAVATQLANAVERAGLMTHHRLSNIDRPVFVPALTEEFTKEGAEELTHILRCAYREMPKEPVARPKEVAMKDAQVLVTVAKQGKSTVLGKSTMIGATSQGPTPQLDLALGGMKPKPKPRKEGVMDKEQWEASVQKATEEVSVEFGVPGDIQRYYVSMCMVGQKLMVEMIFLKAQGIYDYRIGRRLYRQNRKQNTS